jgi:hypothetical protein
LDRSYEFCYGGTDPTCFDVRDFMADSKGIRMAVSTRDPTIMEIYYMLVSGNRVVYVDRDESITLAGIMPMQTDRPWKQLLVDGGEYMGLAKIVELNHNMTREFLQAFMARDDASITETYEDETGASATVLGNSRVPFQGTLVFILSQNETLEPGVYQLRVVSPGRQGRHQGCSGEHHRGQTPSSAGPGTRDREEPPARGLKPGISGCCSSDKTLEIFLTLFFFPLWLILTFLAPRLISPKIISRQRY